MAKIEMYAKSWCGFCHRAKALLHSKGVDFEEIDVTNDWERELEMRERSGGFTVPQIFIDGKPIGGYDEMSLLDRQGQLDPMLNR